MFKKWEWGAIYLNGQNSIVQHQFCTTNTYITSGNGFQSYIDLKNNNELRQNYVIESSFSSCSQENCSNLMISYYGNIGLFSSNISKNTVNYYSGYYSHQIYQKINAF